MSTFITSDFHFGDDRMDLMSRPFQSGKEYIEMLIENFNSIISPDDTTIVVGDVCYQNALESLPSIERLNGTKILIRGNHDRGLSDQELSKYFSDIIPEGDGLELEIDGIKCFATHYPSRGREDRFNLVGHVHGVWKCQLNMLNVGVDVHHFLPVNLNKIPFYLKAICEFYDNDAWIAYNSINTKFVGIRGKSGTYFPK